MRDEVGRKGAHCCPHCSKVYTARCNLSRHIRDQHSVAHPSSVVCPVCAKNCRNRSNALTHLYRTHHVTAKQLRSQAGTLFNNTSQDLIHKDLEDLVSATEDQEPPTFSFEDDPYQENDEEVVLS